MKKTIKRKVIVGAVAVAFLSSTGVAFGATDAGAGIKSWYDAQFNKASANVGVVAVKYSAEKFVELNNSKDNLKTEATNTINSTRDTATANATKSIKQESAKYIESVNSTKSQIEGNIDSQFKEIEDNANKALKVASTLAKVGAEAELTVHTNKDGRAALAYVNNEIDLTTNAALTELETEIRGSKKYLQSLLNMKSDTTVEKINKAVDDEITRLLGLITAKTEQLVAKHQAAINNKAAELEAASKLKLEERVKELINEK